MRWLWAYAVAKLKARTERSPSRRSGSIHRFNAVAESPVKYLGLSRRLEGRRKPITRVQIPAGAPKICREAASHAHISQSYALEHRQQSHKGICRGKAPRIPLTSRKRPLFSSRQFICNLRVEVHCHDVMFRSHVMGHPRRLPCNSFSMKAR